VQEALEDATDWASVMATDTSASDADVACRKTLVSALSCIHTLLSCPLLSKAEYLPLLTTLLATFSPACSPNAPPPTPTQLDLSRTAWHPTLRAPKLTKLIALLEPPFVLFQGMLRGAAGSFEQELLLLKVLKAIVDVPELVLQGCGVAEVGVLEHLPQMQRQVNCCII
jgi:hypothetical protein